MKTKIFKDRYEFLNREDRSLNGVSKEFADAHPDFEKDNETNTACWNCSYCSDCSRCSDCSDCSRCSDCSCCSYCSDCSDCSDCSRCSDCSYCSYCSYCSDCSDCSRCSDCSYCSDCSRCSRCSGLKYKNSLQNVKAENAMLNIPKIENIHSTILAAVDKPDAFDMSSWHVCDTTHCRAGWVVFLAGEAGKALEEQTSTEFAAMMIYKESSPILVSPVRFYEDNETAMADIKRCAALEVGGQ